MTAKFMLDTDSVSYALRGEGRVAARLVHHTRSTLCISAVSLGELRYGAQRVNSKKLHRAIDSFITSVTVVPYGADEARRYGVVAAGLHRRGTPIGAADAMIAAHAISLGITLVTNNVKHFARVAGLTIENWA